MHWPLFNTLFLGRRGLLLCALRLSCICLCFAAHCFAPTGIASADDAAQSDAPSAGESGVVSTPPPVAIADSLADETAVEVSAAEAEAGCPECGGCSDCCSCAKRCGTLEFFGPLALVNVHPPNELFLSPVPDAAHALCGGKRSFDLRMDLTNVILRERDLGVLTDYDYEELRISGEYRLGTPQGEWSARLPLYYRSHGILDGIIADFHRLTGLPNGLRNIDPDNLFHYTIATRDGFVYNGQSDEFGLGDLSLGYKHVLSDDGAGDATALRAGLKVPLGDPDKAHGSGSFDFSLGALYEHQFTVHWRGYVNADYVFTGAPDWDNVEHQGGPVTLWAAEYAYKRDTTLLMQYRTHINFLRVGSKEADKDAQEFALGLNHRLSDKLVWSGGFNEDINPETNPDFVLFSYLRWDL